MILLPPLSDGAMESSLDDPAACSSGKSCLHKEPSDPLLVAPAPIQAGYSVGHEVSWSWQHKHASVLNVTEQSAGAEQCKGLVHRRDLDGKRRGTGSRRLVKRAPLGGAVMDPGANTAPAPAPFLHNVPVSNHMDSHHFVGHSAHEVYLKAPPKPPKEDYYEAKGETAEVSRHWQQLNEQANVRGANGAKEITTDEHHSSEQGERRLLQSKKKALPQPEEAVAPPPSNEEQGSGQQRRRRQRSSFANSRAGRKVIGGVVGGAAVVTAGIVGAVAKPHIKKCMNCRRSLDGKREEASGPYGERSLNQEDLNSTRLVKRNVLPSTLQAALGPSSAHFISTDLVRSAFGHTHTANLAPPPEPPLDMWEPTGRLAQIRDEWSASFKADHDAPAALLRKSKASARLHRIASSSAMSNPRKLRAFGDFQERPTRTHGAVPGPASSPRSREGYGQEMAAALGFTGGAVSLLVGAANAHRIKSALSCCYSRVARTGTLHQISPQDVDAVEPVVVPGNGPGNHLPALEHGTAHQANHQPHRNGHHLAAAYHHPHARRGAVGAADIGAIRLVRRCPTESSLDGPPSSLTPSLAHHVSTASDDLENREDAAGGRVPRKYLLGSTSKEVEPIVSEILPGHVLGLVRDNLGGTFTKLGSFWRAVVYSILFSRILGTAGEHGLAAFDLSNTVQWAGKVKERCLQCSDRIHSSLTAAAGIVEARGTCVTRIGAATSTTPRQAAGAQGWRSEAPVHMLVKRLNPPTKGGLGEKAMLAGASVAALGAGFVGVKALMGGTDPVEKRALH